MSLLFCSFKFKLVGLGNFCYSFVFLCSSKMFLAWGAWLWKYYFQFYLINLTFLRRVHKDDAVSFFQMTLFQCSGSTSNSSPIFFGASKSEARSTISLPLALSPSSVWEWLGRSIYIFKQNFSLLQLVNTTGVVASSWLHIINWEFIYKCIGYKVTFFSKDNLE